MTISTTPNRGYPWPNNDEPVTNGWDAIRDVAVAVDTDLAGLGAWTAYVPTITGPTVTVNEARYCKLGRLVTGQVQVTLTAGFGAVVMGVSLPVAAKALVGTNPICGQVQATDQGVGYHHTHAYLVSTTKCEFWGIGGSGTNWQGAVPFTWAAGDSLRVLFTYESAA
jgi:hypothetical protein